MIQREILLVDFTRLCGFSQGSFCKKFPISTGRNALLKAANLLQLIGNIENEARQLSLSLPS